MKPTISQIIETVADHTQLKVADILGSSRAVPIPTARAMCVYIARTCTDASFPLIARALRYNSHSSCIQAFQRLGDEGRKDCVAIIASGCLEREPIVVNATRRDGEARLAAIRQHHNWRSAMRRVLIDAGVPPEEIDLRISRLSASPPDPSPGAPR